MGYVFVDVAGRDLGGYVAAAKAAVAERIAKDDLLPPGYGIASTGQ